MRRRKLVVGVAASVVLAAICAAGAVGTGAGCTTHECDPSEYVLCPSGCELNDAGQAVGPPFCVYCNTQGSPLPIIIGGEKVDANTWESNPIDGTWLPYHGNTTIIVMFPPPFAYGRTPGDVEVFVGLTANANMTQFTPASGQLALVSNEVGGTLDNAGQPFLPGGLTLVNGTCAIYFVRLVVHFDPIDGDASLDSGSSATVTDATGAGDGPADAKPSGIVLDAGGE